MGKKMPADPIKRIDDIHYIQAYIKAQNKTHSHRNYILFILGITTGYRVGDLVTLRVKDIKRALSYGYFQIEEGKTKKIRKVPIVPNLKKELKDYIKNKKDYEYMFYSQKGRNLGVKGVTDILKEDAEDLKLRDINLSAHSLRKTFAYRVWMENGKDIFYVKELLGHSTVEYTKRYLGLDIELYGRTLSSLNNLIL